MGLNVERGLRTLSFNPFLPPLKLVLKSPQTLESHYIRAAKCRDPVFSNLNLNPCEVKSLVLVYISGKLFELIFS